MRLTRLALGILAIVVCLGPNKLYAQPQAIDVNKSSLKIRVFKSGAFSAFTHDHEIQASIITKYKLQLTRVRSSPPRVQALELRVDSRKMRVLDPEISVDKRAEIQQTKEGNAVLDSEIRSFSCCPCRSKNTPSVVPSSSPRHRKEKHPSPASTTAVT